MVYVVNQTPDAMELSDPVAPFALLLRDFFGLGTVWIMHQVFLISFQHSRAHKLTHNRSEHQHIAKPVMRDCSKGLSRKVWLHIVFHMSKIQHRYVD